jgi:hypothetical protein
MNIVFNTIITNKSDITNEKLIIIDKFVIDKKPEQVVELSV